MYISIIFEICSLVYIGILSVIYFRKKRINNIENKIYSNLVVQVILILLVEFICCLTGLLNLDSHSIFVNVISRILLSLMIFWALSFYYYIYAITHESENNKLLKNKTKNTIITYLLSFIVIMLPLNYYKDNMITYSFGLGVIYTYVIATICIIFEIFHIIKNFSNIKKEKIYPLILLLILIVLMVLTKLINPGINLIASSFAIVIFLMYFTIENPDLKMIEQLNIARDQAEKANHAKSDFLSSMSHEIRTPLNAIVGFSQALTEEDLPPQAKDEVKDIMMASETLLEIVNGILDISKIEANKLEIVNTEYNFNLILEELVSLTKARLGEKPLEFKYRFDPSIPPYLYGDKVRVKQIILNLLTNAVKYTKEGWISFEVNAIQKDGICRLIISVEDSGIGIKPESIDKLFTKFERLDIEKNNTIEGTGLGLAITKKLLDLMGGQVVVQSVYGQGSKFTVAIDQKIVTNPTTVVESTQVSVENLDLSTKKILVVDDNKINLKVAARLLSDYHCQIETLESGIECIDQIKAGNTYDLILMDDMMPKLSGVETFHQLQQIPGFSIPTIALTANAISGMKEKYLQEGFHDYLAKPIDKKELYTVLAKFLVQK